MLSKNRKPFKTWIEISRQALLKNFFTFKNIVGKNTKICCVVKANAYGHDLDQIVPILDKTGADWFAVDNIEEALTIRSLGIDKSILVLGYIPEDKISLAINNNISFVLYSNRVLRKILYLKLKKKARVHIKIETGLNRQGLFGKELLKLVKIICANGDLVQLEGISTHFANVEDTLSPFYYQKQLTRFIKERKKIKKICKTKFISHCSATGASLLYNNAHFDMIRVGIGLYGLWPSREIKIALASNKKKKIVLKPVLAWKSILAQIKRIKTGESVGYGRTWSALRESKIGIIPVGYSDGYPRGLSNNSRVLVNGDYAPIIGRVAMNMIVVDLTDIKRVKEGNMVVLIGSLGKNVITVEEIAERMGTINYEIVSRINPILPRLIV